MAKYFAPVDAPVEPTPVDTSQDVALGATLQGSPMQFDNAVGERLMTQGLAAKTDDGWMRGYNWHNVYGG